MNRFVEIYDSDKGQVLLHVDSVEYLDTGHYGTYIHLISGGYVTDKRSMQEIADLLSDHNIQEQP